MARSGHQWSAVGVGVGAGNPAAALCWPPVVAPRSLRPPLPPTSLPWLSSVSSSPSSTPLPSPCASPSSLSFLQWPPSAVVLPSPCQWPALLSPKWPPPLSRATVALPTGQWGGFQSFASSASLQSLVSVPPTPTSGTVSSLPSTPSLPRSLPSSAALRSPVQSGRRTGREVEGEDELEEGEEADESGPRHVLSNGSSTDDADGSSQSSSSSSSSASLSSEGGDGSGGGGVGLRRRRSRRYRMSDLLTTAHRRPIAHLPYSTQRQFTVKASEMRRWSGAELDEEVELRLRVMADGEGRLWMVAKDVCALIGKRVGSVGRAIHSLGGREKGRMVVQHGEGRMGKGSGREEAVQVMSVLSVDGVKRLLGRSRCHRAGRLLSALLADIQRLPPSAPPSTPPSPAAEPTSRRGYKRPRGVADDDVGSGEESGEKGGQSTQPQLPASSSVASGRPLAQAAVHSSPIPSSSSDLRKSRPSAFRPLSPSPLATSRSAPSPLSTYSTRPTALFSPVILISQQ